MNDTFVAQSTPPGVSALAVIRINGPWSEVLAKKLHGTKTDPIQPRTAYFARFRDEHDNLIDEVVWVYFPPGSSYTGDALLEIMPHGNPLICDAIIQYACRSGCRIAEPGEFTQRAYLNGKLKFSQISGVLELIHAQSDRALSAARKRLSGEPGRLLLGMVQDMISLRAEIEAYIDFPEDELPPSSTSASIDRISRCIHRLQQLASASRHHALIRDGFDCVIVGPPNAGKSSLMNLLLGHNRALVSNVAGTTRDYLLERITIGGFLVNLFDTAGLNVAPLESLEAEGIKNTIELLQRAHFVLLVVDSSTCFPSLSTEVIARIHEGNCLIIENKIDLKTSSDWGTHFPRLPHVRVSTKTREGIDTLETAWKSMICEHLDLQRDDDILFDHREGSFITASIEELKMALDLMQNENSIELVAFHLQRASEELIKVDSPIDHDSILDQLFKRFCIGK